MFLLSRSYVLLHVENCMYMWSFHRSRECQNTHSWNCSRFLDQMRRLLKLFRNCSVFVARFSSHSKQQVKQVAQFSFTKKPLKKLYFVVYFPCSWWWKCKFLNKLNCRLVTLGGIIIFSLPMRQEGSGWNAGRLLPEVVCNWRGECKTMLNDDLGEKKNHLKKSWILACGFHFVWETLLWSFFRWVALRFREITYAKNAFVMINRAYPLL